jgi:hypothetical protein
MVAVSVLVLPVVNEVEESEAFRLAVAWVTTMTTVFPVLAE